MMSSKLGRFLIATSALALIGSSCGGSTSAGPSNKTLVVATSIQGSTLDESRDNGHTPDQINMQMYQTLLLVNEQDTTKLDPDIAQSYVSSPDGLHVTFNLRHDIVFSDGTPLTSDDVVFSITRLANIKAAPAYIVAGITVAALDKYTVVATAATPSATLAFIFANPYTSIFN